MEFEVAGLDPRQIYKLLMGSVVPRPIAWLTTQSKNGTVNAAPFSCYTFVSTVPPLVAISCGRKDGIIKDTVTHAVAAGSFVLNVVSEDLLTPMHHSSAEFPQTVSEVEALSIETVPSRIVVPPRIAQAPISMECRTDQVLEFGSLRTQLLVGEVLLFHVRDDCERDGRIVTSALKPLARLGGPYYARLGEILEIDPVAEYFHYTSAPRS